jgi:hypothetical protein
MQIAANQTNCQSSSVILPPIIQLTMPFDLACNIAVLTAPVVMFIGFFMPSVVMVSASFAVFCHPSPLALASVF